MKIKSHFEDVDQLIAEVKAVTIKNKTRQAKFSAIDYPSQPVPTRSGSWLNAALHYAKNLPEVKGIVESFVGCEILVTIKQRLACKKVVCLVNCSKSKTNINA